ncbi:MAG: DUF1206 domain-containing protein [Actinocrinis sp.]
MSLHAGGFSARRLTRRSARRTTRKAARSNTVRGLGRVGFAARGLVYVLIGWIALLIVFHHNALQADRTGALELVAGTSIGLVLLWFLVVGFAGMALWRLSQAAYPTSRQTRKAGSRAGSFVRAVFYAAAGASTLDFVLAHRLSGSSDQVSRDFTTRTMAHQGGRALVAIVGLALIVGGLAQVWRGVTRTFAKNLKLSRLSAAQRRGVMWLGTVGSVARGIVFAVIGWFMFDAALTFDPSRAKGVDSALRSFAAADYGPVLLILMALGLVAFGAYSWCEARWRRL